jgi:hypothetical protein
LLESTTGGILKAGKIAILFTLPAYISGISQAKPASTMPAPHGGAASPSTPNISPLRRDLRAASSTFATLDSYQLSLVQKAQEIVYNALKASDSQGFQRMNGGSTFYVRSFLFPASGFHECGIAVSLRPVYPD